VVHVVFAVVVYCSKLGVCPKDWNRYQSKHNGRHDFQIDIGLAVLNHVIACKKGYFCINDHITGITHAGKKQSAKKMVYKYGIRVKTDECSTVRVNLEKGSKHCEMWYRLQGYEGMVSQKVRKR